MFSGAWAHLQCTVLITVTSPLPAPLVTTNGIVLIKAPHTHAGPKRLQNNKWLTITRIKVNAASDPQSIH